MSLPIRIGIVEDQKLFKEGLKAIIAGWPEMELMFESDNGFSVIQKLEEATQLPEILLVDLSLPADTNGNTFSGKEVILAVREKYPSIQPMVLSVTKDPFTIARLITIGAKGYLLKDSDPDEVYEAITTLHKKGSYMNSHTMKAIQNRLAGRLQTTDSAALLTHREIEVLKLICQQLTAEEIGERLFISSATVNGHRNNLLHKTGSRNITGLVMYAIRNGIVELN